MTRNDLTIYDKAASHWWTQDVPWIKTLHAMVPGRLSWFNQHINWEDKTVLDLGCAGGFMSEALHDLGAQVWGIDPAQDAIQAAQTHATQTGKHIAYTTGTGENLPYPDALFDSVVCVDVLEHVQDLDTVIREIARCLKPQGRFFFDTINRTRLAKFATITMAENTMKLLPKGTHDPALYVTPDELKASLGNAGLTPGPMTGLGPHSFSLTGPKTFGPLPFKSILYMGYADKLTDT